MIYLFLAIFIISKQQKELILNKDIRFFEEDYSNYISDIENSQRLQSNQALCVCGCIFRSISQLPGEGGAIYITNTFAILDSTFHNCKASIGGSIHSLNSYESIISNCSLIFNYAYFEGGSLYLLSDKHYSIEKCQFVINYVEFEGTVNCGGSIYISKSNGTIENCTFDNNQASSFEVEKDYYIRYAYGGAIYYIQSNCTINKCIFQANQAFTVSRFADSYTTCKGEAICLRTSECNLTNCVFFKNLINGGEEYNFPMLEGEAIYCNETSKINIFNCDFFDNSIEFFGRGFRMTSKLQGGCISSEYSEVIINKCNFTNNSLY